MKQKNKHTLLFVIFGMCFLVIGLTLAITLGAAKTGISDVWNSIFHYEDSLELMLIRDVRIPRALCVLITGGVLGVTGAMVQGVTRNPIAEPSLLGISQGATLVIAIFYACEIAINSKSILLAAFLGALVSGITVIGFTAKRPENMSIAKLLLAGTAMSTFFISLTTVIGLLSNRAEMIAFWVSGGFRNAGWAEVLLISVIGIPGVIIALLLSSRINILSLGDDVAIGLGLNPGRIRFTTFLVMIPMCAATVAVGKNIGFAGLIIPQIVRMLLGQDYRRNLPCCFLLGSLLLTYADIAARMLFAPYETPVGIFTALIGIPFFIAMARKEHG
jgi:iron complex transport system permease protein